MFAVLMGRAVSGSRRDFSQICDRCVDVMSMDVKRRELLKGVGAMFGSGDYSLQGSRLLSANSDTPQPRRLR